MFQKSVNREFKSNQFRYLAESFILWMKTINYAPETVRKSNDCLREFFHHLETKQVQTLKAYRNDYTDTFFDYLLHRPNMRYGGSLGASYTNHYVNTLRRFGRYLQQSGKADIVFNTKALKAPQTATYLSKYEIKSLYKAASDEDNPYNYRDVAMLHVYYALGLRRNEGVSLNTSDILPDRNLVYVRKAKGSRERYVPLNPKVKSALTDYIHLQRPQLLNDAPCDALLLNRRGQRWTVFGAYRRLKYLQQQSDNPGLIEKSFGLHILRHSIATHLLQSGMKLENISHFLGHKSLESTKIYTHIANDTK